MIKTILLTSLCFISFCSAQQKTATRLEELFTKLKNSKVDTIRVGILIKIAENYYDVAVEIDHPRAADSIAPYAQQALSLSNKLNYQQGIGKSYLLLSNAAEVKNQLDKAESYANKAIAVFTKTGNKNNLAVAYETLYNSKAGTTSPEENIEFYQKIRQLYKEAGNAEREAYALGEIANWQISTGQVKLGQATAYESLRICEKIGYKQTQNLYAILTTSHYQLGDYKEALNCAMKCSQLLEKFHDQTGYAGDMYNDLFSIYMALDNNEKALECLQKAYKIYLTIDNPDGTALIEANLVKVLIKMGKQKEAFLYLHKMEKRYPFLSNDTRQFVVARLILTYTNMKDFKSASKYIGRAVAFSEEMPQLDYMQSAFYPPLLRYYYNTGEYVKARKYASLCKMLGQKNENKEFLSYAFQMLFKLDSIEKKYMPAIANLNLHQKYQDSLLSESKNKQIAELEIKYDTDKKDKDLLLKDQKNLLLKKQGELQQTKLSEANFAKNIGFAGIFILLAVAGFLYYNYRQKQKNNQMLQQQKNEINQKNKVLTTLLDEKEWLLKEIHHRVKNNLQIVMSLLNTQSHYLKDEAATTAIRNSQHRIHSMALIHKKLYQSDNLVAIDMSAYVKELIEYLRTSFGNKQRIQFVTDIDTVELDACQAVPLGLIINEAITNAIKYAFPDDSEGIITITLKPAKNNSYILTIEDNGIGLKSDFDIKKVTTLGLRLIKGLSSDLEAKLNIRNKNGLSISIEFVFDEKIVVLKDISQEKLTA